jgi:hypothetical protein
MGIFSWANLLAKKRLKIAILSNYRFQNCLFFFCGASDFSGSVPPSKEDTFYSPSNMKVLQQSIQEANKGKLTAHELIENDL